MVALTASPGVDDGLTFSIEPEGGVSNTNGLVNLVGVHNHRDANLGS